MWYELVFKQYIYLFECVVFSFWVEELVVDECNDVEDEEDIEVMEVNCIQGCWRELCKDQVYNLVGECCDGIIKSVNFDREDFGWIDL